MSGNRLGASTSAYLRSAAHQPVWWHAWGPEAFAEARARDRPVLLDIGAVWCHWCHVMDEESYEDAALAALLNDQFVCVKVDRDERPDVDTRYQRAVQAITRQGGWPLTGFLTPGAELFFGGTYFPPEPSPGLPSFRQVLDRVTQVWETERGRVEQQATALREAMGAFLDESAPGAVGDLELTEAGHRILASADRRHGGFGHRPKFPHPATLLFLLHRWCDAPEPTLREVIERTLEGMAAGGFRDLLGGGFHRYSVDERWIVPHFEKMASDNAELLQLFAAAGTLFGRTEWLAAAADVVRWVETTLAQPGGGFGASQDADLGAGDDGSYFTWTAEEIGAVLDPPEAEVALAWYGIGTHGRMPHEPGRNVLFRATPRADPPAALGAIERKLLAARNARPRPFVDPTCYAGWNAMLAGALLRGGAQLGSASAVSLGLAAMTRLRADQAEEGRIRHRAGSDLRLLEDAVWCVSAGIDAWEVSGDASWLTWAEAVMDRTVEDFWDPARGGFFDRAAGPAGEGLLTMPVKPIQDSPNASPNGIAGIALARLFEHTGAPRWRERHHALVGAFGGLGPHLGLFASAYLLAADWAAHPACQLTISGPPGDPVADALHRRALRAFIPRSAVIRRVDDTVRAIACVGNRCLAPTADPEEWGVRLRSLVPAASPAG